MQRDADAPIRGARVELARLRGQARAQLRGREPSVRYRVLLVGTELGHGAPVARDHEDRVVAEALPSARRVTDLAAHLTLEELDPAVGRRERRDAHEPRAAGLHPFEQREQPAVALLRRRVLAEEAAAAQTRRAAERVDLEARIVGDGAEAGRR